MIGTIQIFQSLIQSKLLMEKVGDKTVLHFAKHSHTKLDVFRAEEEGCIHKYNFPTTKLRNDAVTSVY